MLDRKDDMQTVDEEIIDKFDENDKNTYTGKNLISIGTAKDGGDGRRYVRLYNRTFWNYHKFRSVKEMVSYLGLSAQRKKDMKTYWKEVQDELGMTASAALKWYNAVAYKHFVASIDNFHVRKFALNPIKKSVMPMKLAELHVAKDKLDQLKKDNIYHVAPYVLRTNATPSTLKERFGKGAWKTVSKNSFAKNKLISEYIGHFELSASKRLSALPSGVLKSLQRTGHSLDVMEWVAANCKGKYTNSDYIKRAAIVVRDTIHMANQLNERVSMKWDYTKFEEEHERLLLLQRNRYRHPIFHTPALVNDDAIFEGSDSLISIEEIVHDKVYKAIPLVRHSELIEEGNRMRHCVASYARYCASNQYAVYSIQIDGKPYSTLGLQKLRNKYIFEQHRAVCNQEVKDEIAIKLAAAILKELNKDVDKMEEQQHNDVVDMLRWNF